MRERPGSWLAFARRKAGEDAHDLAVVRWLYLRALGAVLAVAFLSFWMQAEGLAGDAGILPTAEYLPRVGERLGAEAYLRLPTLAWLWPSSGGLHALCAVGTVASLLVVLNLAPALSLAVAWVSYLSLFYGVQRWLSFQWDLLLLEAAFLGLLIAPWRLRPRGPGDDPAPRYAVWLHRWLLARLLFSSGAGKWLADDGTWRELTALDYHFWTQPIPNPLAYWAHHAGEEIHAALVVLTFVTQLVGPVLLFLGKGPRRIGAGLIIAGQLGIAATGNFAYFNLLTLALCLLALDDELLQAAARKVRAAPLLARLRRSAEGARAGARAHRIIARGAAVLIIFLSTVQMASSLGADRAVPDVAQEAADVFRPLRLVSGYGLFTRMTTSRPEVEIEGSHDGRTWAPYVFPYKIGPLDRAPPFVAPHQPRLDWQMWFAALGSARRNPWVYRLMERLLEEEPAVLALLERNPFPDGPPRYIRAFLYRYRFTSPDERAETGRWWVKEPVGPYTRSLERRSARER